MHGALLHLKWPHPFSMKAFNRLYGLNKILIAMKMGFIHQGNDTHLTGQGIDALKIGFYLCFLGIAELVKYVLQGVNIVFF